MTKVHYGLLAEIAGVLLAAMWQWRRAARGQAHSQHHAHERGEAIFRNTPQAAPGSPF